MSDEFTDTELKEQGEAVKEHLLKDCREMPKTAAQETEEIMAEIVAMTPMLKEAASTEGLTGYGQYIQSHGGIDERNVQYPAAPGRKRAVNKKDIYGTLVQPQKRTVTAVVGEVVSLHDQEYEVTEVDEGRGVAKVQNRANPSDEREVTLDSLSATASRYKTAEEAFPAEEEEGKPEGADTVKTEEEVKQELEEIKDQTMTPSNEEEFEGEPSIQGETATTVVKRIITDPEVAQIVVHKMLDQLADDPSAIRMLESSSYEVPSHIDHRNALQAVEAIAAAMGKTLTAALQDIT